MSRRRQNLYGVTVVSAAAASILYNIYNTR